MLPLATLLLAEAAPPVMEVGLSARHTDEVSLGPRVAGRLAWEQNRWGVEVGLWGRVPQDVLAPLDQTVLAISIQGGNRGLEWPVEHDAVALDILGDWGVGGERSPGRAWGGLRLRAGLTVREAIRFVATANPEWEVGDAVDDAAIATPTTPVLLPGPAGGIAFEGGTGRLTVTAGGLWRVAVEPSETADASASLRASWAAELGVRWVVGGLR